jgi:hypothetical protein
MTNLNICIKSFILGSSCEEKRSVARSFRRYGAFGRCLAKYGLVLGTSAVRALISGEARTSMHAANWVITQYQRSQPADHSALI